jgi:MarR family transcriptional regulator, organic hydroperoxide resistance regulator
MQYHPRVPAAPDPNALKDAQDILARVRSLRRGLLQGARGELARSGLTGAQATVVSLLGTRGPLTVSELAHELQFGHSTVSGIVDRLQTRGIVQRLTDPADRRYTRVALTEELRRKVPSLMASGPGSRMLAALAGASPAERKTMREGLTLLQRYLMPSSDPTS